MNKYSRQLRIGRVFVCSASSGRKYAILADFTQCLVTQCLYAFLPFVIAFPALPNGLFRLAEKPVSCRDMVRPAPPYGQSGSAEKPFSSSVVTFSPARQP